ncbi:MAG: PilT/PilU family type 4a pilus ATPase [Acidithiobacillus ferriphilus]|jgi:twitching motility protein PilU|uniref:Type IV pili twitching motility protein PilT n=2 Tax=Acidithiobacillus TaxID=119977 RepID=A0A179B8C5_ACIFR|nr:MULTISPECIES: PilT/PilU family type 4a pilus ATPase [Acidithiobacillus]MDA8151921.1 PilT/PilU family type 4a pilus ATPase [Acidithiobacillus sp.]MBU2831690.1 PilT/PilU family type 4a pilus ATPase [Acidithiobacillus ferriphilus]MBU2852826.1 PilT/PilU family type 4a pilus ATPase [Acidithiobacillus ferriphilus]MBW9249617.1 PilT/PilU family type 4a pilus ATPase [Acidithiobacillus ferriphilus]MBW9255431.1 PilT/PilU family type 4a pilus ATPase [Acidithiobacillus ferriphilus]
MSVLDDLLVLMVEKNGSDLYLTVGSPPVMKIDGKAVSLGTEMLKPSQVLNLAKEILGMERLQEFQREKEINMAISAPGIGRFRVNGFFQRGELSFVLRAIKTQIPSLEQLRLPPILKDLAMTSRGLVLFVGATGSGKSTSLASMIQYRNQNAAGHILTIEDPIEFLHKNAMSIVNQREVGIDTLNYERALENALREAPDVILIGEVRSRDTMDHAMAYAETGHLCMSTLHANNANQAIERIINFFPEDRKKQLLMDLSLNLRAVVSQRLLPIKGQGGRVAAIEVLINTPAIADLIYKGEVGLLKDAMARTNDVGMQTFDQSLRQLFMDGLVEYEDALRGADSQNDLRLAIKQECMRRGVEDPGASTSAEGQWRIQS